MPDSPDQTQKTPSVAAPEHHPLDDIMGIFKDEPLWDDLMEEIRKGRERASRVSSQSKTQ
jgi:hypothetical protein